jgi:hypothetical protein
MIIKKIIIILCLLFMAAPAAWARFGVNNPEAFQTNERQQFMEGYSSGTGYSLNSNYSRPNKGGPLYRALTGALGTFVLIGCVYLFRFIYHLVKTKKKETENTSAKKDDQAEREEPYRYATTIQPESKPTFPAAPPLDIVDQIKRLAELRDQGILTEEEFQQQKTKLLNL